VPLRVGLVAAMLLLVGWACWRPASRSRPILRHDLINRVDQTLIDASNSGRRRRGASPLPARTGAESGAAAVELLCAGHRPRRPGLDRGQRPRRRAELPDDNDVGTDPTTVGSMDRSHMRWRAVSMHGRAAS
jgi:two-component system OmpR family sensor kinase